MPAPFGVLQKLSGVGVVSGCNKPTGVLGEREAVRAGRHPRDRDRIAAEFAVVVRGRLQPGHDRQQRRFAGEPECFHVTVLGAQRDTERTVAVGQRHRRRAVERKPQAARRKRDPGRNVDRTVGQGGAQSPADLAQADGSANVEDRLAQPVLHVAHVVRGDPHAIAKFGSGIACHGSLRRNNVHVAKGESADGAGDKAQRRSAARTA